LGKWGQAGSRAFTLRELAELERTYRRLLAVKAHLKALKENQEMSALFPTFLSLGQRIKRLLATDIKSIWQALEESREPTQEVFFDGFIYHPPIA
jgi:hypothetical protein